MARSRRVIRLILDYYDGSNLSVAKMLRDYRNMWGYSLREALADMARAIRDEQRHGWTFCPSCGCNNTDGACSCILEDMTAEDIEKLLG